MDSRVPETAAQAGAPVPDDSEFSYEQAFSRNLGWVTAAEQQTLRTKRIAIAGMGGVGGSHLLTLTRLGIGSFHLSDFDTFELANFNRQAGAAMSTLGEPKVDTMARMARDINPTLDLAIFPHGIDETNLDAFLAGVDVYVDSLDFFVLDLRRKLFARCAALGIPVVIAGPIGMGSGYLVFQPGGMSFEEYFRLEGLSPERQRVNFALGLTPRGFQRTYLMDVSRVDLKNERGPSTAIACELCAGVAGAEVLKILLKRGRVRAAPRYHQFDAYAGRWVKGWLPGGNRNPLQRLKLAVGYRLSARLTRNAAPVMAAAKSDIEAILDVARWAPSGDNIQPWRFAIEGEDRATVTVRLPGDVYDYGRGEPTLLAAGGLLETLRIAASGRQRGMEWRTLEGDDRTHRVAVDFPRQRTLERDPLLPFVPIRSVDRRAYRLTPLTGAQKSALEAALGESFAVTWHESLAERWAAARLNAAGTDIRLRIPEAHEVHRRVIDWERDFSPTGIPGSAIGLDPLARQLTRSLMKEWRRLALANRLGGTGLARLEMDLVPGVFCAAHFSIRSKDPNRRVGNRAGFLLAAGQAVQRFWLSATRLGLVLQPSLAPLCFARYGADGTAFTRDARELDRARKLAARVTEMWPDGEPPIFLGRIGEPATRRIRARSMRQDLAELLVQSDGSQEPSRVTEAPANAARLIA